MQRITSFFLFCSGSDVQLLNRCPTETSKYVGIGATIFFTGLFAALAGGYAIHSVFDNVIATIVFAALWGLMIFNLDRYIVSSMRKQGRAMQEFTFAIPRLILAVLISMVIAKPLELKIFEKEIEPELIVMEQEKFAQQEAVIRQRYSRTQDSLKSEAVLLRNEIDSKSRKRDELVRIAQEEADGTGGSKKKNPGPIYKIKKANADQAESELNFIRDKNEKQIRELEQLIIKNDLSISNEIASWKRDKMNGLAARIEALDRLTNESYAIRWAHWFIILLFIAIETAPVFVKLISSKGPYDNLLKVEENNFAVIEVESLASSHSQAKERASIIRQHEKDYVNDRLDAMLKKS